MSRDTSFNHNDSSYNMDSPFDDSHEFISDRDDTFDFFPDLPQSSRTGSILKSSRSGSAAGYKQKPRLHFANDNPYDTNGTDDNDDANSIVATPAINSQATFATAGGLYLKDAHTHTNFSEEEDDSISDLPKRKGTINRLRWGTQRHKNGSPLTRNKTFKRALSKRVPGGGKIFGGNDKQEEEDSDEDDSLDRSKEHRQVYWNLAIPESQLDNNGQPPNYARNKIRTTKYTPLSFIPKNLYFQFENVANIYFLAINILGAFEVFGVPNPALSAVPLIVIIAITAFKDALEDSRRTVLDLEVNNQVTHILKGMTNPNFNGENISLWRRLKKLTSRSVMKTVKKIKGQNTVDPLAEDGRRDSFDFRKSFQIEDPEFQSSSVSLSENPNPFDDVNQTSSSPNFGVPAMKPFTAAPSAVAGNFNPTFKKDYWKNVHVGDIIKIKNNDSVPVDLMILSTSDSDGGCYVETKNLDGETNLKVKQALKCSASSIKSVNDLGRCKFWLDSEGPKSNLYSYQGNLKYYVEGDENNEIANEPVTINNLLLRGCTLRNTKWVVGIVAFTGDDTKTMMNAGATPTKKSRISRELNWSVVLNFLLLFVLCLVSGIVNGLYYRRQNTSRDFFEYGTIASSPTANGILGFFVALILYGSLVPISLYISIEIIKTAQAFFIYSDVNMYYEKLDYPCTPKSWNISDDIGQIEYIFSDKTGTLTQNVMEFKKCTINGVSYGRAYTEAYAGIRRRQGIDVEEEAAFEKEEIRKDKAAMIQLLRDANQGDLSPDIDEELTFVSKQFAQDMRGDSGEAQKLANEHFMLALALCHSVLTEPSEKKPGKLELKAQSPDEAALVATARDVGFEFTNRTKKGVVLSVQGVEKEYEILNVLEFNSTRKRMSAIIKIPKTTKDGEPTALLICKGADSIIYSRLASNNDQSLLDRTAVHLEEYATEGLRTLCIAQVELSWSQYEEWQRRHQIASASLTNREDKMEEVASSIEQNLTLLGGTAIEDRLQDGVPESISILAKAGIKLWVLTGDKVETAINIGFSCNLLENGMDILVIKTSGEDVQEVFSENEWKELGGDKNAICAGLINKYLREHFDMEGNLQDLQEAKKIHEPPSGNFAVVIDGDALKVALSDKTRYKFLMLCKQCKAVLCCRVSPAQKAAVVKLVKETLDVMTLAVGDGSNDVAMIQAADVGVGIAGEEGTQAVMSADYAIGQFRFLTRLVLVHGRWSYKRLAEMIPSFFFKNVIFTLSLFWYGIYNDFDGSYLFEYTYLMFYTLAFTSLPVIFLGIFDQDVSATVSLLVPELYRTGIFRSEWTPEKFWWYMVDGFYQSLISFFYPYFMYYKNGIVTANGLPLDHRFLMGALVATIATVSCDIFILSHQYRWDWLSVLICALSILVVFAWTGIWSSSTTSGEFYKAAARLYGSTSFWACFFVGFLICMIPRATYDFIQKLYYPKDVDIIRECVNKGDFNQYPEDYDPTDPDRPSISKYTKEYSVEEQSHSAIRIPEDSQPSNYRDSINGVGGNRGSSLKRLFGRNKANGPTAIPVSQSVDTLATEEIEMDFTQGGRASDGSIIRPSLSVRRNPGMQTDADRFNRLRANINKRSSIDANRKKSLDQTRRELAYDDEGVRNTADDVRTSMELPGLTTAESLIGRLSNGRPN